MMAYNIYYNMTNKLPTVLAFTDLHLTKNLSDAKKALSGLSGVYAIVCNVTSAIYIGSSMNMANRLVAHLIDRDTNAHLQNAIVSPTALSVSVYNLDNVLLKTFSSQVAAAEWLGVSSPILLFLSIFVLVRFFEENILFPLFLSCNL